MKRFLVASAAVLTGLATAVVPAAAHAAEPVPPFVFTSDRDGDSEIYLRTAAGTLRQLTRNTVTDYNAVWSPDGRRLAFVSDRDGDDDIYVMRADGTGVRQLTRNGTLPGGVPIQDQAPAWSPDGRFLAFASTRDGGETEIYRMRADGSQQTRLTRTEPFVFDHTPDWSPDGTSIVFASNRVGEFNVEIFRMRADGSGVVRLTHTPEGVDDNAPQFSPDGRRIVFSRIGAEDSDLFTMRAGGQDVRLLGGTPDLDDVFPQWTPDGRQILFFTFPAFEGPNEDVWIIDRDGTDLRRLTGSAAADSFPDPRPAVS